MRTRRKNSEIRQSFLARSRIEGKLICHYCKRDDLISDDYFLQHKCVTTEEKAMRERCATMDHFYPLNPITTERITDHDFRSQRVVSCPECNDAKDSLSPEEFEKVKDKLIIPWSWRQELIEATERTVEIREKISEIWIFRREMKTERHEPPNFASPFYKGNKNTRRRRNSYRTSKIYRCPENKEFSWNSFKTLVKLFLKGK